MSRFYHFTFGLIEQRPSSFWTVYFIMLFSILLRSGIIDWEWDDLFAEEAPVNHFVKGFGNDKVLVVGIDAPGRINSEEICFTLILKKSFPDRLSKSGVEL